ncbi:hypothetical protein RB195_014607 [Necator americanus]|uniref:Endonuclease/exonuclease/phosphatase domain-containing protein n=1 Tax=Necator americanus TaxID=51031 RepID=A0ABR1E251_NECAM
MEPSTKLCISLLIFSPAFIYFLYAISKSPEVDTATFIPESDMIFVPQRFDLGEREEANLLADNSAYKLVPSEADSCISERLEFWHFEKENYEEARTYPRSRTPDAHCPCPGNVANIRGLPARGRSRPKKLVCHRQQHPVRLATHNVGTLTGRSRELADSLRKRRVDICCVQETRWKGSKSRELGDGYKLIFIYHGTSNRNGVGIILNESFRNSVTVVDRLSDRLMAAKVDTGEVELRVVSAYAPQVGCSGEEKVCFWEDLEQYVQSLEGEEVLLIGGDFNGYVGSRKDGFESCHGGYGYGARNDDGLRILEYVVASDMIIANTQYRKRKSHLITYTSGGRETQIDFRMLRRRDRRLLQNSKVIPTDHVAAQHHLLVMDLKISRPRKRHPRTETQRIKWWNLKDRKERYTLDRGKHSGKDYSRQAQGTKATWFWNEEVQAAIREKSKYKLWWKTLSKAKLDRYKAVYDMLDTREGERAVYRLVRARHRSTLDMEHTKIVKGADGAILRRSGQILERWREYYNHLCKEEFCHPPIPTVPSVEDPVLPITAVEVNAALAKMKSNKATGPDDIPADVWKPVWKGKEDIADCTSYRPIRLLCHTMKVFERVLEARLRKIVSVSLNQCEGRTCEGLQHYRCYPGCPDPPGETSREEPQCASCFSRSQESFRPCPT